MKYFLVVILALLSFISSAQSTKLLEIDESSFAPVQTDLLSGVAIDKIGMDPSRRPCARIKIHVNRMSKEDINGLYVRTIGGSVVVTRCVAASEGNGLIIELTAKAPARFYLHHEKYGDSNEVSLNLEGNKEYRLEASLNTTYSIVVQSDVSEAEVYIDDVYRGNTADDHTLTVRNVYPGRHSIKVVRGSFTKKADVEVNGDNVFFRLNLETGQIQRHFVTFKIEPRGALLKIDGEAYGKVDKQEISASLSEGEHSYCISADMYHEEKGTIVVGGPDIVKEVKLKPAHGWLQVSEKCNLKGASLYIDDRFVGLTPIKTGRLASGDHKIRIEHKQYRPLDQKITISDLQTLDFVPVMEPISGRVDVSSQPEGAEIFVDNQYIGKTPMQFDHLVGTHEVYIQKEGFQRDVRWVEIKENDITRIVATLSDGTDLSTKGSANCYIISKSGTYTFPTVKGNSAESVGAVASADVLWESFGTDVTPMIGDLVSKVSYSDGIIAFHTSHPFKEGNAVIAARDAAGTILWSWHIWLTDHPQGQEYFNNAGTMMDRNLGATSAIPGDVGALGLLYQWGRKDPFLNSSSISFSVLAKSTIIWPKSVRSNSKKGTIEYATANPTTFITRNSKSIDWFYTGSSSSRNTNWTESDKPKSIYDPCPAGWRVPDGSRKSVWSKAEGSNSREFENKHDMVRRGMNFSGKFGADHTIWYPFSGVRFFRKDTLECVGKFGFYWSASYYNTDYSYGMTLGSYFDDVQPKDYSASACSKSVRCIQE